LAGNQKVFQRENSHVGEASHSRYGALRRHAIAQAEFDRAMREHDIRSPIAIDEARLEANGKITFLTSAEESQETNCVT
jgi:uncharacterized membrane protein YcaP (DUF421 family)